MAKGFVYRGAKRTTDSIARKSKEGSKDYDSCFKAGLPTFKPKEGENVIRILPSGSDKDPDWDFTLYSHYNVGADNGRYLCLAKMKDEDCPVCEAKMKATDEEEADALNVGKGCIVWIIDRDNEKAGPQLWSMPFTKVRNEVYARSIDKKTKTPILVDDPEEGYDISFTRKGTGLTTAYTGVEIDRDPSPLHDKQATQDQWLDYVSENALPDILNFFEADYIEKVLMGKVERKKPEPEDEEEEAPRRSEKRAAAKEEDEEEAPRSSRRRPAAEPEDEEEEAPSRSARRVSKKDEEEEDAPAADTRSSRRRALLDDEEEEKPVRRKSSKDEEDDDIPFDKKTAGKGRGREQPQEEDEAAEDAPVAAARRSLERLKKR